MVCRNLVAASIVGLVVLGLSTPRASAQNEATVRVEKPDAVVRSRPSARSEELLPVPVGTVLVLLDRDPDWLWVLLPADTNGTRRPGWLRASDIEPPSADDQPASSKSKAGRKQKTQEDRQLDQQQAAEARSQKKQEAAEARRLKREQVAQARAEKQQAEAERRAQRQQAKQDRRAGEQRAAEERRVKLQQADEEKRLEKMRRDLDKAKKDYDKLTQLNPPPPQ